MHDLARPSPSPKTFAGATRPFVLLEDRLAPGRPATLYADPVAIVRCDDPFDADAALARIEAGVARGLHAAGFLSYALGEALEPKLRARLGLADGWPLLWFGLFAEPRRVGAEELDAMFAQLGPPAPISPPLANFDRAPHEAKVRRVKDYLFAGDAYQVNLTHRLDFAYGGDPLALYGAMRARQPVAHGGVVAMAEATIVSVSPELFLEVAGGMATTRPMKGTSPRGAGPELDAALAAALQADPKQRAENLMIVDLMRNDLSRICGVGTVKAPEMFRLETYPTLHTLTSTVTGTLRAGTGIADIVRAIFPCGSITGAPKHRAMQIIHEIEAAPRGVYTGAIGAFAPDGAARLNVAIRTATLFPDGRGAYGVGGGIVADSDPGAEYDECLVKARVLSDLAEDYGLIETLLWSPRQSFVRLELHLARLAASAKSLGFRFDAPAARARLRELADALAARPLERRVRLELARGGGLAIADAVLAPERAGILSVALAPERVDAGDPFLRHKTTQRRLYDAAFAAAAAGGHDEALFLNRDGRLAEASRNSVFVEVAGALATPPLADGALPGVLRQAMLDAGEAVEAPLTLQHLRAARRWFLGNSLRGLREARLAR